MGDKVKNEYIKEQINKAMNEETDIELADIQKCYNRNLKLLPSNIKLLEIKE